MTLNNNGIMNINPGVSFAQSGQIFTSGSSSIINIATGASLTINVTYNGSGTTVPFTNNGTINNAGTLTFAGLSYLSNSNTRTINNSGTIIGNILNSGTIDNTLGTVVPYGTGGTWVSGSASAVKLGTSYKYAAPGTGSGGGLFSQVSANV